MADKPKKSKSKRQRVDVNLEELDGIIDSAQEKPLSAPEAHKVKEALHSLAERVLRMRNSEKMADIFDEPEGPIIEKEADGTVSVRRKGHGRNSAARFTGAKKVPVAHPDLLPGAACPCAECHKGKVYPFREPSPIVRIVGQSPFQATVYECERFRCNLCGEVFTAPTPEGVGPERYDETVSSMVAQLKYGSGMPFTRLESLQKQLGVPLPASVQWALVEAAAHLLEPVHDELIRQAAQGQVIHNDDTSMRVLVLERPADDKRTGVFTSGVVSQPAEDGPKVALFFTGRQHAGENLRDVLERRANELSAPIQMCDALSRNVPKLPEGVEILVANCLSHGRRHFVDVAESFPTACRHVLEKLGEVYRNDEQARSQRLTPAERLKFHQKNSKPVLNELRRWMAAQLEEKQVEPNSGLGKAMRYFETHWKALTLFLRVAGAPLDNNICERALKKAVLHRKNALFYLTLNGAQVGDLFMSLIHTCELNSTNAFEYMVELQRHAEELKLDPAAWLPWNFREQLARAPA